VWDDLSGQARRRGCYSCLRRRQVQGLSTTHVS
jgi:hypothetical protein